MTTPLPRRQTSDDKKAFELRLDDTPQVELRHVNLAEFRTYTAWQERYAPPSIRKLNPFVAAAEQATRYGRQVAALSPFATPDMVNVFAAWQGFIAQFEGNVREVLTRTFWQAYHS